MQPTVFGQRSPSEQLAGQCLAWGHSDSSRWGKSVFASPTQIYNLPGVLISRSTPPPYFTSALHLLVCSVSKSVNCWIKRCCFVWFIQCHQSDRWEDYGVCYQRQDLPRLRVQSQWKSHPLDRGTIHLTLALLILRSINTNVLIIQKPLEAAGLNVLSFFY